MDGHKISTKRLLCKLANFPKEKETIPEVSAGKATSDDSPRPQPGRPTRPSRTTNDRRAAAGHRPTNTSPTRTSEQLPISTLSSSRSLPGVSRSSSTPNLPSAPSSAKNKPGSLVSSPRRLSTNLYIKSLLPSDTEGTSPTLSISHPHTSVPSVASASPQIPKGAKLLLFPPGCPVRSLAAPRIGIPSLAPVTLRTHSPSGWYFLCCSMR